MAAVDRTVRRLHLQAASHEDARRAALRLEDALRCASLPDVGRRLLFVRRLSLGPVRADASAQAWALRLETAMAQSRLRWLPGDAPQAATADAVWFRDALHAHLALGLRLARGPAPAAWFWPRLLPALAQAPDTPTALGAVMHAVAALPEAPAALPAWVAAMAREGFTKALIAAVPRADVAPLWRALGGAPGPASLHAPAAAAADNHPGIDASAPPYAEPRALVARALRLAGEERAARLVEAPGLAGAPDAAAAPRAPGATPSSGCLLYT
ncbi:hypothetical protein SM757_34335, partial [Azohydromonas lata]|nr:hypothetical protein [Azohydromonas lata]